MPRESIPQSRIDEQYWTPQQSEAPSLAKLGEAYGPKPAPNEYSGPIGPGENRAVDVAIRETTKRVNAPPPRGDDLLASAQSFNNLDREEQKFVKRFMESKQLITAKISEDPEFADRTAERFQNLYGADLTDAVIDEADQLKIERLKEEHPEIFNNSEAMSAGFLNSWTMGQMTRLMGAANTMKGADYDATVEQQAEKFRLLDKAFPGHGMAGKALGFLAPGPAKLMWALGSSPFAGVSKKILEKIASNPVLQNKAAQFLGKVGAKAAGSALQMGGGSAVTGLVEGTLGKDLEAISFDRGVENSLASGTAGFFIGGAIPAVAGGVELGGKLASPYVKSAARSFKGAVENVIEATGGAEIPALRMLRKAPEVLRKAYGIENQLGKKLSSVIGKFNEGDLVERTQADAILPNMQAMDARPLLDFFRNIPKDANPVQRKAFEAAQKEWLPFIESQLGVTTGADASKIAPAQMRKVIDLLQSHIRKSGGYQDQGVQGVVEVLRAGSGLGLGKLLDHASTQGEAGKLYTGLMEKVAERHQIVSDIEKLLGKGEFQQAKNAEGFFSRLFGTNKSFWQARMADLDKAEGTNFLELAKLSNFAQQVGADGKGSLVSMFKTGRSKLGTGAGLAAGYAADSLYEATTGKKTNIGTGIGGAVGLAVSSPAAAAKLIGASDNISGFARRMLANPEVLQRLARGQERGFPIEVQKMARIVQDALVKDGPVSAMSAMRIIGDSPYFVGLVHAHNLASRKYQQKQDNATLAKIQSQQTQPEVAVPKQ